MRECRWMCNYYIGGGGRCGLASVHGCTLACMYALLHAGCRTGGLVRTCVCRISKCITRISQCISRAGHAMVPPALSRCGCGLGDSTRRPGPGEFGPLPAPAGPGQHAAANSAATSNGQSRLSSPGIEASLSRVGAAACNTAFRPGVHVYYEPEPSHSDAACSRTRVRGAPRPFRASNGGSLASGAGEGDDEAPKDPSVLGGRASCRVHAARRAAM